MTERIERTSIARPPDDVWAALADFGAISRWAPGVGHSSLTTGSTETPDHMEAYQEVAGSVAVPNGVRIDAWFSAEGTILGDGRQWHQVRFNTFPSRRAFMAVALDPDRLKAHSEHRETAIADTYAIGVWASINTLSESVSASTSVPESESTPIESGSQP